MNKKIVSSLLSFIMIAQVPLNATITGTPEVNDPNTNIVCEFNSSEDFYPVGDTSGKSIYTKQEVIRDCNVTKQVQGKCLRWREEKTIASVPTEAYNTFDNTNYSDSVGSFFATAGAYDQMEHLWSGFAGYCVDGTLRDFNWVSDPMFWGSIAMSYLMSGGEAGSISDGFNKGVNSAGEAAMTEASANSVVLSTVQSATKSGVYMGIEGTGTELAKFTLQKAYSTLGKCLVSGGFNMATSTADFLMAGSGDSNQEDCNPIDEICNDEEDSNGGESKIQTMDVVTFTDLTNNFLEQGDNIYDFIEVYDDGTDSGVVTFRYKKKHEMGLEGMDTDSANEIAEKMKIIQFAIGMGIAAGGMAACMLTDGVAGGSISVENTTKDSNKQMLQSGLNSAIDFGAKFAGPMGPAIAVVGKVLVALAMSYESIDSCHDKEDASKMGSRHEKTEKSIKFNLCRPMWDTCEDKFIWGKCALQGYHFCCYDQLLTKVLVEQIKAELGREWKSCSGISIRDLNYISFRQCTTTEMADGIDGAKSYGISSINENPFIPDGYDGPIWNPEEAFQYKHKCMDMSEFEEYLEAQLGESIDKDSFEDFWNGLTKKDPI